MATLPNWQAAGTQTVGTGAISPPWPASHAVDDIALLVVQTSNEAVTLSDPQGFQEITGLTQGTGVAAAVGSTRLTVFWCRATSTSMATPTIADPGDHVIGRIGTFRNCVKTGVPWDVLAVDVLSVADTAVTIPGGTTTVSACLAVLLVANGIDSAASQLDSQANADLGSITERFDGNTSNGTGGGVCLTTGTKAAIGTFGSTTANLAASSKQVRAVIMLKPVSMRGTGAPTKTLGSSGSGTATQTFTGAGTPTTSLSGTGAGVATETFTGAGTPTQTIAATGSGVATQTADSAVTPDVYAWFPGDGLPGHGKRYEEYAEEEQKKPVRRRKRKLLPPAPLPPPPVSVDPPAPLESFLAPPITLPVPIEIPSTPWVPSAPPIEGPVEEPLPPISGPRPIEWTDYAHLPIDPQDEAAEMAVLMSLIRGK